MLENKPFQNPENSLKDKEVKTALSPPATVESKKEASDSKGQKGEKSSDL
jgi:hypothetical protein